MEPWYPGAVRVDAHHVRIGGVIAPRGAIVHTTDTLRGSAPAIVHSWATTPGRGNAAHGIIAVDGTFTQMIRFDLNANHAGGHGITFGGLSPNLVTIGIEIEAPGRLGPMRGGKWVHPDTGMVIAPELVYVDVHGIGWGLIADEQLATLGAILTWASPTFDGAPPMGALVHPGTYEENGVPWAACPDGARVTGHVTSNPIEKTDPGPQVMAWLEGRAWR